VTDAITVAMLSVAFLISTPYVHAQDKRGAGDTAFYRIQFRIHDSNDLSPKRRGSIR
jgi:hypothetical protein